MHGNINDDRCIWWRWWKYIFMLHDEMDAMMMNDDEIFLWMMIRWMMIRWMMINVKWNVFDCAKDEWWMQD
jgi:hypothetical protein